MGKRFVVAVDVSTSLSSIVPGSSVSTAVAAAAITMVREYYVGNCRASWKSCDCSRVSRHPIFRRSLGHRIGVFMHTVDSCEIPSPLKLSFSPQVLQVALAEKFAITMMILRFVKRIVLREA